MLLFGRRVPFHKNKQATVFLGFFPFLCVSPTTGPSVSLKIWPICFCLFLNVSKVRHCILIGNVYAVASNCFITKLCTSPNFAQNTWIKEHSPFLHFPLKTFLRTQLPLLLMVCHSDTVYHPICFLFRKFVWTNLFMLRGVHDMRLCCSSPNTNIIPIMLFDFIFSLFFFFNCICFFTLIFFQFKKNSLIIFYLFIFFPTTFVFTVFQLHIFLLHFSNWLFLIETF